MMGTPIFDQLHREMFAERAVTAAGLAIGVGLIWATQFFDDPLSF